MSVLLKTKRLVLREFTGNDLEFLVELDKDPEVVRYIPGVRGGRDETRVFLLHILETHDREAGYGFWAAMEKETNRFIGWFMFRPFKTASYFDPDLSGQDDIEIGCRFSQKAWGKGYATEGGGAIIQMARSLNPAIPIMALSLDANTASIRVLEKLGLKREKRLVGETSKLEFSLYRLYH